MWDYYVYYDFKKEEIWYYNKVFITRLKDKHLHKEAEKEAINFIKKLKPEQYRINKIGVD